jgi:hypothetical protein
MFHNWDVDCPSERLAKLAENFLTVIFPRYKWPSLQITFS